jgi:hypothetical protein
VKKLLCIASLACAASSATACTSEYHPEYHPQSSYSLSQNLSYPVTVFQTTGHMAGSELHASPPARAGNDPARVLILQSTHLDRPAQVVGVVDAHEEMGKHDGALRALQTKAAQLGADAVVGVEFHHGEAQGEPTHLSGLAVRFLPAVPYPVD